MIWAVTHICLAHCCHSQLHERVHTFLCVFYGASCFPPSASVNQRHRGGMMEWMGRKNEWLCANNEDELKDLSHQTRGYCLCVITQSYSTSTSLGQECQDTRQHSHADLFGVWCLISMWLTNMQSNSVQISHLIFFISLNNKKDHI